MITDFSEDMLYGELGEVVMRLKRKMKSKGARARGLQIWRAFVGVCVTLCWESVNKLSSG
jgi:hypothetical protein